MNAYTPSSHPHIRARVARDRLNAIDAGDLFRVVRADAVAGTVELEQLDPPRPTHVIVGDDAEIEIRYRTPGEGWRRKTFTSSAKRDAFVRKLDEDVEVQFVSDMPEAGS